MHDIKHAAEMFPELKRRLMDAFREHLLAEADEDPGIRKVRQTPRDPDWPLRAAAIPVRSAGTLITALFQRHTCRIRMRA